MNKKVGVWIDRRKAVVVTITDTEVETTEVQSNLRKHIRFSDNPRSKPEGILAGSEDVRERQFINHLHQYYDAVIRCIYDAEAIFLFGPGESKNEFRERLNRCRLGARIVGVQSVDKLTDLQIVAKVQHYFEDKVHPS